jgi:hypothetical protein
MRITIIGRALPGPSVDGHANVHVALQVGAEPDNPVAGDAEQATWMTEVRRIDGDVRGPAVHGRRGERFLYLTWGDPAGENWRMFKRTKLMLDPMVEELPDETDSLIVTVDLTDARGIPRSGRLKPPAIRWSASPE